MSSYTRSFRSICIYSMSICDVDNGIRAEYTEPMNHASRKPRVLVAEDEPLIGADLEELLVALGYEVPRVIDSVDMVLPAFRDCRPDIVIMDIRLRSFNDGIDAARRLRLFSEVPVIFLSAHSDEATYKRAKDINSSVFLSKPLDENRLATEIARFLSLTH